MRRAACRRRAVDEAAAPPPGRTGAIIDGRMALDRPPGAFTMPDLIRFALAT